MNQKQAELAIIQEAIVQILGYDDDLNVMDYTGHKLDEMHKNRLSFILRILRERVWLGYMASVYDEGSVSELKKAEQKLDFFEEMENGTENDSIGTGDQQNSQETGAH